MPPRAYLLLLVGVLASGVLGCATLGSFPAGVSSEAVAQGDGNVAKRQLRPATFVAFGELHEKSATDPARSPAEQEDFRNKARLAYQQALQISPNDLPALTALARLYLSEGDYDRAVATYNRAIQVYPNNAAVRYELGMCHARRKNWDLALQSLQKAVEADPENRIYVHTYGLCLARSQRYDESFAVLARLEGTANAHYDLARMLHHLERDEVSKEHLRLALAENPEHVGAQQLFAALEAAMPGSPYPIVPTGGEHPDTNAEHTILGRPVHVLQP